MKIRKTLPEEFLIPVFRPDLETATGGFKLDVTGLVPGSIVAAGAALSFDEITRLAKVIKSAVVNANAGASATNITVKKNSGLKVGDIVGKNQAGKASTITAIDSTNALFDTITIDAALGALTAGDVLFQSSTASTTNGSAVIYPFDKEHGGLNKNSVIVDITDDVHVDAVIKGTVYRRRIPGISDAMVAALPTIIFSNSK